MSICILQNSLNGTFQICGYCVKSYINKKYRNAIYFIIVTTNPLLSNTTGLVENWNTTYRCTKLYPFVVPSEPGICDFLVSPHSYDTGSLSERLPLLFLSLLTLGSPLRGIRFGELALYCIHIALIFHTQPPQKPLLSLLVPYKVAFVRTLFLSSFIEI